jgi:hypothetical protein
VKRELGKGRLPGRRNMQLRGTAIEASADGDVIQRLAAG